MEYPVALADALKAKRLHRHMRGYGPFVFVLLTYPERAPYHGPINLASFIASLCQHGHDACLPCAYRGMESTDTPVGKESNGLLLKFSKAIQMRFCDWDTVNVVAL
jgi:hypothetical protein